MLQGRMAAVHVETGEVRSNDQHLVLDVDRMFMAEGLLI